MPRGRCLPTAASRVYVMEPFWNPAVENQAIDRVHRLGQTRPVQTIRYIISGSIEENMLQVRPLDALARDVSASDDDPLPHRFRSARPSLPSRIPSSRDRDRCLTRCCSMSLSNTLSKAQLAARRIEDLRTLFKEPGAAAMPSAKTAGAKEPDVMVVDD